MMLVATERDRSDRRRRCARCARSRFVVRIDRRGAGHPVLAVAARLGAGDARQAFVRAPLRLSRRMAALHRHARARPRAPRRSRSASSRRSPTSTDSPAGLLLVRDGDGLGAGARGGTGTATAPASADARAGRAISSERPHPRPRRGPRGSRQPAKPRSRAALDAGSPTPGLAVPLVHLDRLVGRGPARAAADRPRARLGGFRPVPHRRPPGRRAISPRRARQEALADAERFDEFNRRFAFIMHDIKNLVSQLTPGRAQRRAPRRQSRIPRRHDRDAAELGGQDERPARPPVAAQRRRGRPKLARGRAAGRWSSVVAAQRPRQHPVVGRAAADALALADPARLEQALGHLVQNAIEASAPDRPGHASTSPPPTAATVARGRSTAATACRAAFVRDQLFQPFVSTKAGGFGIGAFEARAARRRRWAAGSTSTAAKARARVSPSCSAARATAWRLEIGRSAHDRRTTNAKLLIVEDDDGLQRQLRWAYDDYEVIVAARPRRGDRCAARRGAGGGDARPRPAARSRRRRPRASPTLDEILRAQARHQGDRRLRPRRARKRAAGDRRRAPMISTRSRSTSTRSA